LAIIRKNHLSLTRQIFLNTLIKLSDLFIPQLGKAAVVAGLSYLAFHELLIKYGVPVVTMTEEDVHTEVAHAIKYYPM